MAIAAEFAVRRCDQADLPGILAIHAAQGNRPAASLPSATEVATWARMMGMEDLRVYVAVIDARAVGTATLTLLPNVTYACAPSAIIESVVVVPEHRRRGIARSIVEMALADAARLGCYKIQLLSHKRHSTDGAHALYASLGFVAEAEGFRRYLPRPSGDTI